MQEARVQFLGWEDPLEEEMATTPVFLPGKSHGQRRLVGYSPWGHKELDTTKRLSTHACRVPRKSIYIIAYLSPSHLQQC